MANNVNVTLDTLIAIKIQFQGHTKKFKIPLRDLGAQVLPEKLRTLLQISPDEDVVFERYSDSAGAYVTLDSDKPQVYKTLFRAAKAKLKLRLRATLVRDENEASTSSPTATYPETRHITAVSVSPPVEPSPAIAHSPPVAYAKGKQVAIANIDNEDEAPVPRPFPNCERFINELAEVSHNLAFRPKEPEPPCSWIVYCNHCEEPMESEHFHCSICENGDYDLCPSCVESGVHCPGAGHWMVKRFVQNGIVVNSTTERVGPKPKVDAKKEMPGAFRDERKTLFEPEQPTRTCNCCVKVFPENEFVTCTSCEDYDLCLTCHTTAKHGHHPGHSFQGATPETNLTAVGEYLCNAGRNVRHSAVCDGCEKFIYGVRHKCLNCPDWDFCSECIKSAKYIHPRHRFVPIYEPLTEPTTTSMRHYGIYCDGPLCKDKENVSYIEGVRFKCAVCHDTDFCANCEAFPHNRHNRTHPLIKFKTPVRSVSVTTMGEDKNGVALTRMGDQPAQKSASTETNPVALSTNAATQVQTIVDLKPAEEMQSKPNKEKIEIKDLLSEPIQEAEPMQEKIKVADLLASSEGTQEVASQSAQSDMSSTRKAKTKKPELDAHFIRDTITDGTKVFAGFQFVQVWTLRNPGPLAWPAGCSVRHVGGDNMLNLDNTQPLSQSELAEASESNVIGRPVEVGEEIAFRIVMRAPKREGTAISYWRLKTADGAPFGHRLWCDIQVTTPPTPVTQSSPVPEASSPNSIPRDLILERIRKAKEQAAMKTVEPNTRATDAAREQRSTQIAPLDHERMQQIQQFKKAALERLYESRRKLSAEKLIRDFASRDSVLSEEEPVKSEPVAEAPVQKEPLPELRSQSSGMIFPQLDKESPVSSTHEAIESKSESQQSKSDAPSGAAASESGEEFFEDAESVDILETSSDDGFMTDEEYDILDASDEEMP